MDAPKPPTFRGTTRQWKQQKRRDARALLHAADKFLMGSAYTPTEFYPNIYDAIKKLSTDTSIKAWGR